MELEAGELTEQRLQTSSKQWAQEVEASGTGDLEKQGEAATARRTRYELCLFCALRSGLRILPSPLERRETTVFENTVRLGLECQGDEGPREMKVLRVHQEKL